MYQSSDSDSVDSDEGVRFKTENIRNKIHRKTENKLRNSSDGGYSNSDSKGKRHSKHSSREEKTVKYKQRSSNSDDKKQKVSKSKERRVKDSDSTKCQKNSSCDLNTSAENKSNFSIIGPALPPNLQKNVHEEKLEDYDNKATLGFTLPEAEQKIDVIGPHLPPHLQSKSSDQVGPALPQNLVNKIQRETNSPSKEESTIGHVSQATIGPLLPPHLQNKSSEQVDTLVGPALPINLENKIQTKINFPSKEKEFAIGPVLPQEIIGPSVSLRMQNKSFEEQKETKSELLGPALPPHLRKTQNNDEFRSVIGPALPQNMKKEDLESNMYIQNEFADMEEDEDVYGPLPPGSSGRSAAQIALEERALQMKLDRLDTSKSGAPSRETWMLELPENKVSNLGLAPRQFRSKAGPDMSDRSCWTDTPEDKKRKKSQKDEIHDLKQLSKQKEIEAKNVVQEQIIKKHKKKNDQSLLEMHQEKLKKQKQEQGPSERRPFSRELDLQVNRFDEAQKKSVLKKAQLLDDRFARGQSKFI